MKTLNLAQGTQEWAAHRAKSRNASDASAMMGCSPNVTRSELVKRYATGIVPEPESYRQKIFDKGHRVEFGLREIAESFFGEELYAVVAVSDDGYLSASLDGVTMSEGAIAECKQTNQEKMADIRAQKLPESDYWQVVQQFAVCGSAQKCLYVCGDGTIENSAHMEVLRSHIEADIPKLRAGWEQFDKDVAAYKPEAVKAEVVAAPVEGFGALMLRVEGRVVASNLKDFKADAEAFIARLPKPSDLQTDQDFANADAAVKACAEAESKIKAQKEAALSQMSDVDALLRTVDSVAETIRAARLSLDKVVKAEKENRRAELIRGGVDAVREHYHGINATLPGFELGVPASLAPDIGAAIKGLKSLDSIRDKIAGAVANAKISASQEADRRRACIALLPKDRSLFPDAAALVASKHPEDIKNLIAARVADHEAKKQERLEAERAKMRAEEEARAQREAERLAEQERHRIREEEQAKARAEAEDRERAAKLEAPRQAVIQPQGRAKNRPAGAEIVAVLAQHYRVHESQVIEWLCDMGLDSIEIQRQ